MTSVADIVRHSSQPIDAVSESSEVAIRWRNHCRRPAHQKVPGKSEIPRIEDQMIAEVARQMSGFQPPTSALDYRSLPDPPVRPELQIDALPAAERPTCDLHQSLHRRRA